MYTHIYIYIRTDPITLPCSLARGVMRGVITSYLIVITLIKIAYFIHDMCVKGCKLVKQKHLLVKKKLGCRVPRLKKVWKQDHFDTVV